MRVKSVAQRNHRKTLKLAKGFKQARSKRIKTAKEAVAHAGKYAYQGRKNKRRDLRSLWIVRISAALKEKGLSYSKFMSSLKKENVQIDRKILSELAVKEKSAFDKIVETVKK